MRDYEYKRLGTLSLLAAVDLLTGEAIPLVSESHKSSDFVAFLKLIDSKYPTSHRIRIILDNHSAHASKETQEFSKMTRQMLTGIRVETKEELTERIYKYFDEVNAIPVPYKWKYKMDSINLEDEDIANIVYEVVNAKAASLENEGKRAPETRQQKRDRLASKLITES